MTTAPSYELKPWHSPHNDDCEQNKDSERDCTCKLKIERKGPRKEKSRVRIKVKDDTVWIHRVKPDLHAEIRNDGKLIIRELKRRVSYETTIGKVYCNLVRSFALQAARTKAAERAAKRKSAKQARKLAKKTH